MKPTRTSYSALTTFEQCPFAYAKYYFEGFKDEAGPAAARGTRLHAAMEKFLKDELPIERLPIDFWRVKPNIVKLKDKKAIAEEVWLINSRWEYQEVEDESTIFKSLTDIHLVEDDVLSIYDLKSGRMYDEHSDQLQAYALAGMVKYPQVTTVNVSAIYLDQADEGHKRTYTSADFPNLKALWGIRINNVLTATEYPTKPSPKACQWCKLKKSLGGPCPELL